jgi:hypothetical protein
MLGSALFLFSVVLTTENRNKAKELRCLVWDLTAR